VLMHAKGSPLTMQDDPSYADVLLDVYDDLARRLAKAQALGIPRSRIAIDPGIGFGKTSAHNLALIRRMSMFHSLGCPILLGASRKRFIGSIGGAEAPADRVAGSLAVALEGFAQGVQIARVHDVADTRQALRLWQALRQDVLGGGQP
jgi:dihydropteroate synthase